MTEKHQWNQSLLAVKHVFDVTKAAENTELNQLMQENQYVREIIAQYTDPNALIRDAMDYSLSDTAAAWDRLVEMEPRLKAVNKEELFANPSTVPRTPWISRSRRYWVAASLILITVGALCYPFYQLVFKRNSHMKSTKQTPHESGPSAPPNTMLYPGSYKLDITLPDSMRLKASVIPEKDTSIFDNMHMKRSGTGTLICRTTTGPKNAQYVYRLATPEGGWYNIVLPDKSHLSLNAASSIEFNGSFGRSNRRLVQQGEAYFEVASQTLSNAPSSFQVDIPWVRDTVHVITVGANFNISAYTEDSVIQITVLKGTLQIKSNQGNVILQPGWQYSYTNQVKKTELKAEDIDAILGWKDGKFSLSGKQLPEILRPISRWYGAQVVYRSHWPDLRFDLQALRTQPINDVLSMLAATGQFHYALLKDSIVITP